MFLGTSHVAGVQPQLESSAGAAAAAGWSPHLVRKAGKSGYDIKKHKPQGRREW